jgi:hypothetical protein
MSTTITDVHDAFHFLFTSLCKKDFSKSLNLSHRSERELLPLVRTFLLGYFGARIQPEALGKLPGAPTGKGRIDFIVDDVAVELAVRRPRYSKRHLRVVGNETEVKKLLCYQGKALLVLFDFSGKPLAAEDLHSYRTLPELDEEHSISPFQISYFYVDDYNEHAVQKLQIRARS